MIREERSKNGYIESVYLLQVHAGLNSHLNFV